MAAALLTGRVKVFNRLLLQTVSVVVIAAGFLVTLISSFITAALLVVYFKEGKLLEPDRKLFEQAPVWLLVGLIAVAAVRWFYVQTVGKQTGDTSFKLISSNSHKTEAGVDTVITILFFGMLTSWIWAVLPGNLLTRVPLVIVSIVAVQIGIYFCITLHEFGHLSAAWCMNMRLRKIQIGTGPVIWSHTCANGFIWELRAAPRGGFAFATPRSGKLRRIQGFFFVAGGPLMDLILLSSMYQLIGHLFGGFGAAHGPFGLILSILFWLHAVVAACGILPSKVWLGNQQVRTDGYLLLHLLTGRIQREFPNSSRWAEALDFLQQDSSEPALANDDSVNLPSFQEQQAVLGSRLLRSR